MLAEIFAVDERQGWKPLKAHRQRTCPTETDSLPEPPKLPETVSVEEVGMIKELRH